MSFTRVANTQNSLAEIYLFGGVTNHCLDGADHYSDFLFLVPQLQRSQLGINLWTSQPLAQDAKMQTSNHDEKMSSLEELTASLKNQIKLTQQITVFIGYSAGAHIASSVAAAIKTEFPHAPIALIILDAPPLKCFQQFCQDQPKRASQDLFNIIKKIAKDTDFVIKQAGLKLLSANFSLLTQLAHLLKQITCDENCTDNFNQFTFLATCYEYLLKMLLEQNSTTIAAPLEHVIILTTQETVGKYQLTEQIYKQHYTGTPSLTMRTLDDPQINHITLLGRKNSTLVATHILKFLSPILLNVKPAKLVPARLPAAEKKKHFSPSSKGNTFLLLASTPAVALLSPDCTMNMATEFDENSPPPPTVCGHNLRRTQSCRQQDQVRLFTARNKKKEAVKKKEETELFTYHA